MIISKFGGTSISHLDKVSDIIRDNSEQKIIVLSAFSKVTNQLEELIENLKINDKVKANSTITGIRNLHLQIIDTFFNTQLYNQKAIKILNKHLSYLSSFTDTTPITIDEKNILAQGEILSTHIFHLYLESQGLKTTLLSSLDFMRIDKEGEPDKYYIQENLKRVISEHKSCDTFITQGYICRNSLGEVDNLKRGGSDYSASLIGVATNSDEIQIWTDIDGLHNNDPRFVKNTSSIKEISFDESAELAYFGAKILHPLSIFPAKEANIPVRLKNTFKPDKVGTSIGDFYNNNEIKSIAGKDGITVIKIKSYRMLMAYGFLSQVFDIFERYQTPVDMITTSEVAVSITIDDDYNLKNICSELQKYGKVVIEKDLSIICIVGNFEEKKIGKKAEIFNYLQDIPVRMISYGGSNYNISILVKSSDKSKALNQLHQVFTSN